MRNGVATGAQTCPTSNTQHVGYPTGGALAGVWEDTSAAAPAAASGHAIGAAAVTAATRATGFDRHGEVNAGTRLLRALMRADPRLPLSVS